MAKTNFDVTKVALKGSNLIEASAGTGKTYSIAILVIRLVIEKKTELREILMVTFTKAAVAELEVRIRKFIREAFLYTSHGTKIDDTIKAIVDNGIQQSGKDEVLALLMNARRQLDETSIFTIHGFCQLTLNEFAFETGQAFNSDVIEDEAALINEAVGDYWRKNVTTLNRDLLTFLLQNGLSKNQLINVVSKAKRGKLFLYKTDHSVDDYWAMKAQYEDDNQKALKRFNDEFAISPERTIQNIGEKGHAFNAFANLIEDAEAFRKKLLEKQSAKYVGKKFPGLLKLALEVEEFSKKAERVARDCINYLYGNAISFCDTKIQNKKKEQGLFSFDDLINKLHQSISSESLQTAVRKKYKAVFIDEFQDTDQKQYDIFYTFFNQHAILFYIGDPKQSVYSFKGTDLDTYLKAASEVDASYTMSKNYRSTAAYNNAMNKLFTSIDNPFNDCRIDYEVVSAGKYLTEIKKGGEAVDPLSVFKCDNNNELVAQTTNQVKELLLGNYQIEGRKIKPSDIGILVRANSKGQAIKRSLNKANIPAITIDDSRVMESGQSTLLLYLLKAMFEPGTSNINRVLLTCLTNKTKDDLLKLDIEADIGFFRSLNQTWISKGVFSAINAFMEQYHTLENIQTQKSSDAERIITNILQINEILHNKENQSKSSPKELIHWLEFAIAGAEESGDYTQRLENDEDAVKIVTIHKSKGLAYNIVIAPYLDLISEYNNKRDFIEYKDPDENQYCFSDGVTDRALGLYSRQTEQENRRLIYVALTRAVYMGIIIHNTYGSKPNVGIRSFLDKVIQKGDFTFSDNLESDDRKYNDQKEEIDKTPKSFSDSDVHSKWSNYSFSMLSEYEPHDKPQPIVLTGKYDQFIFEEFPKGALAGNFMHYLFENADFTGNDFSVAVLKALNRYKSVFGTGHIDLEEKIAEMLNHVLNSPIPAEKPFVLSQIKNAGKLPEMGFNFKINDVSTKQLHSLVPHINLKREGQIEGLMTGFIDLLFEHEGKFYILDWKSNYLGHSISYYTREKLEVAMQQSNYHLQYLIYTVATKLYLQNTIPDFDYNTHFGGVVYVYARACRKDGNTGIYFTKPEYRLIEKLEKVLVSGKEPV
ncbi:UvrD-helicase domain-containing protein [Geofilum sp. OHC36d9]|uniref:UvrD-helicase domain-containing protein n=1 Tax=Geofilum sp. OHC36d9 TaxID=3458413 RepID=UPI00403465B8